MKQIRPNLSKDYLKDKYLSMYCLFCFRNYKKLKKIAHFTYHEVEVQESRDFCFTLNTMLYFFSRVFCFAYCIFIVNLLSLISQRASFAYRSSKKHESNRKEWIVSIVYSHSFFYIHIFHFIPFAILVPFLSKWEHCLFFKLVLINGDLNIHKKS